MSDKRGISAIVATVMTILITVAAVAIIWVAIIPMINENIEFGALEGRVSIVSSGGYTVYDADEKIAIVQVKRDVDDGVMNRIKIMFSIGGDSISSIVVAPESGQTKTYTFDFSGYGEPESISVAPIFVSGSGSEKEGSVQSKIDVPKNKISDVPVASYDLGEDYFYEMPVTGLVSWWKFNDASDIGKDSVGGNDGNKEGDASIDGDVLNLDGNYDYVDMGVPIDNSLQIAGGLTVSAWVMPIESPLNDICGNCGKMIAGAYYYNSGGSTQRGWSLGLQYGNTSDYINFKVFNESSGPTGPSKSSFFSENMNEWVHVTGVFKSLEYVALYVNGEEVENVTSNIPLHIAYDLNNPFRIGARSDSPAQGNWNGSIDDVMIYDRALGENEINAIYENQKGGKA